MRFMREGDRARAGRVGLFAAVAVFLPAVAWALASPLGSVPDEPAHMIRAAAVVRGEIETPASDVRPDYAGVDVPDYVAKTPALTCFAFDSAVPASCADGVDLTSEAVVPSATSAGLNSPVYYALVGLPTLVASGAPALYAMRLVNAAIFAILAGMIFGQLTLLSATRWGFLAGALGVTPMALFLAGSVNPNGVEVTASGALLVGMLALLKAPGSRVQLWGSGCVVAVSSALVTSGRNIGLMWWALAVGAAVVVAGLARLGLSLRDRVTRVTLVPVVLVIAYAVQWQATLPRYEVIPIGGGSASRASAFALTALRTVDYAEGYVGVFGWLDTLAPPLTMLVFGAALMATVTVAVLVASGRLRATLVGLIVTILLLPPLVQAAVAPEYGPIWQGRYALPVLMMIMVVSGVALDRAHGPGASRRWIVPIAWAGGLMVAGAQVAAFFEALRRYVVGLDAPPLAILRNPQWEPPLGWVTLALIFVASVGLAYWALVREVTARAGSADAARRAPVGAAPALSPGD